MSRRSSSSSRGGGHLHCDSCYSRRCRTRVEVSVSCALASCRLHCGAVFHLCKEEDHLLLCPNVRVPCINAGYGCPLQLPRCACAAHLQACPASVVSCSMEWNRWLSDDTEPHSQRLLREKVTKEWEEQRVEALELSMALVDQSDLYSRLKMKSMYPELVEDEEEEKEEEEVVKRKTKEEEEEEEEASALEGLMNRNEEPSEDRTQISSSLSAAAPDSAKSSSSINVDTHRLFEMMFSMDKGGCTAAQENLNQEEEKKKKKSEGGPKEEKQEDGSSTGGPVPDPGKTGQAPWHEGVLDRLKEDLTPQEYNMYMVHHGRMLLTFGHIEACTPRDRDFVYGSLEPIPVQTVRSFKIPDSYHYRRRVHLYDAASRVQSETRSTDTSDLAASEDEWFTDEAEATLLGYAEREVMGHKVSAPKAADGLYCDVGTQTHWFRSAPFRNRRTTLAQVMERRPLTLQLRLQAESVTGRHHRGTSVFTFVCGHTFHRKEFATHFRNVHADIQTCLSGWFEQRCPLAYLGCTYTWRRFHPSTHRATITYCRELRSFNLRPIIEESLGGPGGAGDEDPLSSLPYEVLCHLASFLDSLSLSQLALVSRLMRQVVWSLLQDRGMVSLRWDRQTSSSPRSRSRWTSKPVWTFSPLFSRVDSWHMSDASPVSAHLKVCPYNQTSARSEPVLLHGMTETSGEGGGRAGPSLLHHFRTRGGPQ